MLSEYNHEQRVMHSKSDDTEIMINDNTDDIIKKFLQLLHSKYDIGLVIIMKGFYFTFGSVRLLYYKCDEISLKSS